MSFNRHFVEMLDALSGERAEFLIIGAYAMARHGLSRATGDLDIWVRPTPENASRVWEALLKFGAPVSDLKPSDFSSPDVVFQMGAPPNRIDILTEIDGVDFDEAWEQRQVWRHGNHEYPVIGSQALIKNKRAVGRTKDIADAEWLERHAP